jgi:hypothetical protein
VLTRALFLGTGVYIALVGTLLFIVDSVTLRAYRGVDSSPLLTFLTVDSLGKARSFNPPEWLPYTLVGIGGVTILYAIAIPKTAWKKEA